MWDEHEFKFLLQDASARVIQTYWREYKTRLQGTSWSQIYGNVVECSRASLQDVERIETDSHIREAKVLRNTVNKIGMDEHAEFNKKNNFETPSKLWEMGTVDLADDAENELPLLPEIDLLCRATPAHELDMNPQPHTNFGFATETLTTPSVHNELELELGLTTAPPSKHQDLLCDTHCRASEKVQSIMELLRKAESQDLHAVSNPSARYDNLEENSQDRSAEPEKIRTCSGSPGITSTQLAESVYDEFKNKVQFLRKDLDDKNTIIQHLQQMHQKAKEDNSNEVQELKKLHAKELEQQKKDNEADLAQRLQFIDALLVDKEQLSSKCEKLLLEVQAQRLDYQKEIEAMKQRWSDELKKQKDAWQFIEKTKKDQWQAQKKKEITELTAKAMQPKLVELAETYTKDTNRLKEKIQTLERLLEEHEKHSMQLRDRLIKEREDAIEKERSTAYMKLLQEKERHKVELESVRERQSTELEKDKRLVNKRMEEQQRQHDDEVQCQQKKFLEDIRKIREEAEREKEVLEKQHHKTLSRVREECGAEREGWKEVVRERAERQMWAELEKRKLVLEQERDSEIEMVLGRLEDEKKVLREEVQKKESEFAAERQIATQAMLKREAELESQANRAEEQRRLAKDDIHRKQQYAAGLNKELERKTEDIQNLENQVNQIRQESMEREKKMLCQFELKEKSFRKVIEDSAAEKIALSQEAEAAKKKIQQVKRHHQAELATVENRVRETLFAKENKVASLQKDITQKQAEIATLKNTLLKQRESLHI